MEKITKNMINNYKQYLVEEEKSDNTISKYIHDIKIFVKWLDDKCLEKITVLEYKKHLTEKYAPSSVNSKLSSLNSFFEFNKWYGLKVKFIKVQKQIFAKQNRELTKTEYERLLGAANDKSNKRMYYLLQTICCTGIRVSELKYITVDAVTSRQAVINCKGKMRIVILPKQLCKMLKGYIRQNNIKRGSVFVSKNGNPLNRSNIWLYMKKLCEFAGVPCEKVFPHNLRHLFAKTYYSLHKDVVRLADILGHSSINTTRIYTMETSEIHRVQIQKLGLLKC